MLSRLVQEMLNFVMNCRPFARQRPQGQLFEYIHILNCDEFIKQLRVLKKFFCLARPIEYSGR